jgi:hypothetical protein
MLIVTMNFGVAIGVVNGKMLPINFENYVNPT